MTWNRFIHFLFFFFLFSLDGQKDNRRKSSGTLVSPEIDMGTAGSTTEAEHDGFYMLKKDSQRRTTLARVLAHDQSTLCKVWFSFIRREFGPPRLTNEHLEVLMKGLRDYIADQDRSIVERTMYNLKKQLDFDPVAVYQLHNSLYFFQDAVMKYIIHFIFLCQMIMQKQVFPNLYVIGNLLNIILAV